MSSDATEQATGETIIDDFEGDDADLGAYKIDESYNGTPEITSSVARMGDKSLRLQANIYGSNNPRLYSTSGDGLDAYPTPGSTFALWTMTDYVRGGFSVYFGGTDMDNCYELHYQLTRDMFILTKWQDGNQEFKKVTTNEASSNTWYRLWFDWREDGEITVELQSTDGTTLARISATDKTYDQRLIGFRRWSGGPTVNSWFDAVLKDAPADPSGTVSGSATTMTLLPGGSEHSGDGKGPACLDHNDSCDDGGDDLDSAMPDYWGKGLDAWFIADQRESLPKQLEDALEVKRSHPEYPGEEFRAYRMKNHIEIKFTSRDSTTIDDWDQVEVQLTDQKPSYVLVEGEGPENDEDNAIRTLINDPPNEDWSWFEGQDRARAIVTRYNQDVVESGNGWAPRNKDVNRVEVDGVEGVRVSVIMGGDDTYITKLNEILYDKTIPEFNDEFPADWKSVPGWLWTPPTLYTFLELIVMADGTTVSRVWDTSPYPKHYLYHDGTRRAENGFKKGTEKGSGIGDVKDGVWLRNQHLNQERFYQWWYQIRFLNVTPFKPYKPKSYEKNWDAEAGWKERGLIRQGHPVMAWGDSGSSLDAGDVFSTFDTPLFPWEGLPWPTKSTRSGT